MSTIPDFADDRTHADLPREVTDDLFTRTDALERALHALAQAVADDLPRVDSAARMSDLVLAAVSVSSWWLTYRDDGKLVMILEDHETSREDVARTAYATGYVRGALHLASHMGSLLGFGSEVLRDMGRKHGPAEAAFYKACASNLDERDLGALCEWRAVAWADVLRLDAHLRRLIFKAAQAQIARGVVKQQQA